MKSYKEWLQELPDGYRELAINQCNIEGVAPDLMEAIWNFANYCNPKEGFGFWQRVHFAYKHSIILLPLPKDES